MNETEYLTSLDPQAMLESFRDRFSVRRLRLFICAACRTRDETMRAELIDHLLDVGERYADGLANDAELFSASRSWSKAARRIHSSVQIGHYHDAVQHDDHLSGRGCTNVRDVEV